MQPDNDVFGEFFDIDLNYAENVSRQPEAIPQQPDVGFQQPDADTMQQYIHPYQVLMTWNSRKLQISGFNKIVVIPVETFVDWGPDDRAQVALYMR